MGRKRKQKKITKLKQVKRWARELIGPIKSTTSIPDKTKYNRKCKHKKKWDKNDY